MNREDIIEMWKHSGGVEIVGMPFSKIEAFAALVASAEREACAKLVDYWESRQGEHSDAIRARGDKHD
jgi:hypothetical protein